jgi:hypothetical protein
MEQENKNRTTYICGICNTKPEQLSHHKAHLKSISHSEQKIICEYNIRRYVLDFRPLIDNEYCNIYLQDEYLAVKTSFIEILALKYSPFNTLNTFDSKETILLGFHSLIE